MRKIAFIAKILQDKAFSLVFLKESCETLFKIAYFVRSLQGLERKLFPQFSCKNPVRLFLKLHSFKILARSFKECITCKDLTRLHFFSTSAVSIRNPLLRLVIMKYENDLEKLSFFWWNVRNTQQTARTETPFNLTDGHRNFFRWASMAHRWPSMGFDLSPSAWGQLWSILGLNISNFNLLTIPFEPEQAFSSLKITFIGALPLNCLKKIEKPGKIAIVRMKRRLIELPLQRNPSACKKKNIRNMQKIGSENTFLYQKNLGFFLGKSTESGFSQR